MNYLYIKVLKVLANAVICVGQKGQKVYYCPISNQKYAYGSGQQVKRCAMERLMSNIEEEFSPVTYRFKKNKEGKLSEDIVKVSCNPSNSDQLLAGYMLAEKEDKKTGEGTVKRRSPFSFSPLKPLPFLANTYNEVLVRDDRDRNNNIIEIKDASGNLLDQEEVMQILGQNDTNKTFSKFTDPDNNVRMNGLYEANIAINLDRLFKVKLAQQDREVTLSTIEELKSEGWEVVNSPQGVCLEAPAQYKEKVIAGIADAIINFRVTSNQSSNFDTMKTLAVSVSDDASKIDRGIRSKLIEERKAKLVINTEVDGLTTYVSELASAYIVVENEDFDAMNKAMADITNRIEAHCLNVVEA